MYGLIIAVAQCEDLKLKYYEEMDKRKKLHNIVQETKGIYYPLFIQFFVLTLNNYLRECILILFVFSTILGNIRVFCRCRPLSKDEVSSGQKCVVDFGGSSDGDIVIANGGTTKKTFKFDRVFTPNDDQGILVITLMCE
jgi:kinesin family protein C2/C3